VGERERVRERKGEGVVSDACKKYQTDYISEVRVTN